jgi:hypothetical protein
MRYKLSLFALNAVWMLLIFLIIPSAVAQIQVNSATPNSAPQGTTNLNVNIGGSGFKKGAKSQFFVTGTTDTGGVVVNSTSFNGSSTLTANITIPTGAVINGYDIVVTNTDGRTGKGTDRFAVTQQGTPIGCSTTGTPSGATLVATLNPVQSNGAALLTTLRLGNAIRIRPLDLDGNGTVDTLVTFVASGSGSGSVPGTYVFFLDPVTGRAQTTNPVTNVAWQNPLVVLAGVRAIKAAVGDVNGDGVPDFAMGGIDGTAYLFVGGVSSATSAKPYAPSYAAYQILPPTGAAGWSQAVAFGDVDGIGVDEIVIGAGGSKTSPPGAFIFKYASGALTFVRKIQDPTGAGGTGFGNALAVGNIDGTGNDLVIGAPTATTNGLVYVFPHPVQQSNYFTLTGTGPNFGRNLGISDLNLDGIGDLLVITGKIGGGQALLYAGTMTASSSYTNQLLPGQANGWGDPNIDVGDMAASGAVAIGAPNASSCSSIQGGQGALNLFTSPFVSSETPNYVFETPSLAGSNQFQFGYSVGIAPGYPFIVIGEHFRDVGTTSMAGQVYVYKLN